jgi:hypothetical protein
MARTDGREAIRGKEYGTGIRTNREPTVRLQGGACLGSVLREGNGPFQGVTLSATFLMCFYLTLCAQRNL